MRIDDRVREAHLSHFCPGGASFPVTTSRPVGLDVESAVPARPVLDAAAAAHGRACERCGRPIAPGQDARRRASGTGNGTGGWVHESCPRG